MQENVRQPVLLHRGGVEGRGASVIAASRGLSSIDGSELGSSKTPSPMGDDRHVNADMAKSIKDRASMPEVAEVLRPPRTGDSIGSK